MSKTTSRLQNYMIVSDLLNTYLDHQQEERDYFAKIDTKERRIVKEGEINYYADDGTKVLPDVDPATTSAKKDNKLYVVEDTREFISEPNPDYNADEAANAIASGSIYNVPENIEIENKGFGNNIQMSRDELDLAGDNWGAIGYPAGTVSPSKGSDTEKTWQNWSEEKKLYREKIQQHGVWMWHYEDGTFEPIMEGLESNETDNYNVHHYKDQGKIVFTNKRDPNDTHTVDVPGFDQWGPEDIAATQFITQGNDWQLHNKETGVLISSGTIGTDKTDNHSLNAATILEYYEKQAGIHGAGGKDVLRSIYDTYNADESITDDEVKEFKGAVDDKLKEVKADKDEAVDQRRDTWGNFFNKTISWKYDQGATIEQKIIDTGQFGQINLTDIKGKEYNVLRSKNALAYLKKIEDLDDNKLGFITKQQGVDLIDDVLVADFTDFKTNKRGILPSKVGGEDIKHSNAGFGSNWRVVKKQDGTIKEIYFYDEQRKVYRKLNDKMTKNASISAGDKLLTPDLEKWHGEEFMKYHYIDYEPKSQKKT